MKTKDAFGALKEYQKYLQEKDKKIQGEDIFLPVDQYKKGLILDYLRILEQMYSINGERSENTLEKLERYEKHSKFLREKYIKLSLGEIDYTELTDSKIEQDKKKRLTNLIRKYSDLINWLRKRIDECCKYDRTIRAALRDTHKKLFGERVRKVREQNKLTQRAMAEKLEIPKTTYTQYEQGKSEMSLWTLANFVKQFGVTADSLLTME